MTASSAAPEVTREEWKAQRRLGLGGSDAAVVLGLSPYKSRYTLWAEKTGLVPDDVAESEAMEWGVRLEPIVAAKYAAVTSRNILELPPGITHHPRIGCMFGTPDRLVNAGNDNGIGVLEVKTTNAFKAEEWEEQPPLAYQVQLQHYLAVTGHKWGSFAVLIGGQKFKWCDVPRNDQFIKTLEADCQEFWKLVETKTPPPVDGSPSTSKVLRTIYPADSGEIIELPIEAEVWATERQGFLLKQKQYEKEIAEIDNKLRAAIGTASIGVLSGGLGSFSLKLVKRGGYEVKPSEARHLRYHKSRLP